MATTRLQTRSRSKTDARKDLRVTDRNSRTRSVKANSRTRSVRTSHKPIAKTISRRLTASVASSVVLQAETIAMAKANRILQRRSRQSSRHPTCQP